MVRRCDVSLIAFLLLAASLGGCKPENKFVAPPAIEISVAPPLRQTVAPFLELSGNTQPFNTVDLVARVEGFLTEINYKDGTAARKGDILFRIDPTIYQAKVKQAEADLASAKAQLDQTQAEFIREETLLRQNVLAQVTYDLAKAKRDTNAANVKNQEASLTIASANLDYTRVVAPFDGIVARHLVSVGELVGTTGQTKLATIVQLDPIYVTFNLSEQDVLSIRAGLKERGAMLEQLSRIPLEIGLMNEEGFPHKGRLDYVAPEVDASTGTILMRGVFANPRLDLLPGLFVRVRLPLGPGDKQALLVPNRVLAEDQAGHYLLVVGKEDVVEQRRVKVGQLLTGGLRVIESGLAAEDRVVTTSGQALPGSKVVPKPTTIQPASN